MPARLPLNFSQPSNKLSTFADNERKSLIPKNDYDTNDQYDSKHPDAKATGDEFGKGTGGDLDVHNEAAGSKTDVSERKKVTVVNQYQPKKPYTTPKA